MESPLTPNFHLIPYAQASPAQLARALVMTREALDPYYPALTWPQWHQAFASVQPALRLEADHVRVPADGLTGLVQYFETRPRVPEPAPQPPPGAVTPLPPPDEAASPPLPRIPISKIQKTYSMRQDVIEGLERVSFWRRKRKSALVNLAVLRLLAGYPEAQVPIPATDV